MTRWLGDNHSTEYTLLLAVAVDSDFRLSWSSAAPQTKVVGFCWGYCRRKSYHSIGEPRMLRWHWLTVIVGVSSESQRRHRQGVTVSVTVCLGWAVRPTPDVSYGIGQGQDVEVNVQGVSCHGSSTVVRWNFKFESSLKLFWLNSQARSFNCGSQILCGIVELTVSLTMKSDYKMQIFVRFHTGATWKL